MTFQQTDMTKSGIESSNSRCLVISLLHWGNSVQSGYLKLMNGPLWSPKARLPGGSGSSCGWCVLLSLWTLVFGARKGSFATWCSVMEAGHKAIMKQGQKLLLQVELKHTPCPAPAPREHTDAAASKAAGTSVSTISDFCPCTFSYLIWDMFSANKQTNKQKSKVEN